MDAVTQSNAAAAEEGAAAAAELAGHAHTTKTAAERLQGIVDGRVASKAAALDPSSVHRTESPTAVGPAPSPTRNSKAFILP